ncbi:hypothetical protein V2I01_12320 [Micromonospora sp. BRA006-A]|nr:hypothetical protein [Micromonospora sp. BRA006-A]
MKDSRTATSKVAARYRTQHKTDFKLVTETGAESSSKRTVRNPNRATPITLHYFKVLQRLELAHERYGARGSAGRPRSRIRRSPSPRRSPADGSGSATTR